RSELEKELSEARSQADAVALKLIKAENLKAEFEVKTIVAEKAVCKAEAMLQQSETLAVEAFEKFKSVEMRLQQETELRIFAEQQLKTLAEQFSVSLVHDLTMDESAELDVSTFQLPAQMSDEGYERLLTEIKTERAGRLAAEKDRKIAESAL